MMLSLMATTSLADDSFTNVLNSLVPNSKGIKVDKIVIINHSIFDQSKKNTIRFHDWANRLHTNTRKSVIRNHLTFKTGDTINPDDLYEAQRILRSQRYLRDAEVYIADLQPGESSNGNGRTIIVETWDNWTLLPTAGFNRTEEGNKLSLGLKDDNFLGYGIRTRLKYKQDPKRDGYLANISAPVNWVDHGNASLNYEKNSDGHIFGFSFDKPFYSKRTKTAFSLSHSDFILIDEIELNGEVDNSFTHHSHFYKGEFGWLYNRNDNNLSRITLGFTESEEHFHSLMKKEVPKERLYSYPWVKYEYLSEDFREFRNVHLINQDEDINLGWNHNIQLGAELNDTRTKGKPGYHLNFNTSKGYTYDGNLWLFNMQGSGTFETSQDDFYRVDVTGEYYNLAHPKWVLFSRIKFTFSEHLPLDMLNSLGDDTGLRGYPDQYQHGDKSWLITGEIRHIPNVNLFQLAELALVGFADVGHTFGSGTFDNENRKTLASVGVGLRIYASKSSNGSVAHIDLAYPITSGIAIDGAEIRFALKKSF
ncbi:ShlB/FhaC/HecB family hemolysin secretion/activation protein [Parashewanella tropica]|uniref:ShlB/FhaC/HecB family hemolysin secretion/activation protein n=1 Tax=Parashewanella tropica TaxID=2547970 RepID=UPI00105A5DC9|nr:ShlB/FhaC/HecB family hemolysin secretion/activation protein [Parashewanella tropica]